MMKKLYNPRFTTE